MTSNDMIAIGVDENDQVWPSHFGGSPYYRIYDGSGTLIEKRLNPYGPLGSTDEHEHHGHGPGRIVKLLPECRIFICSQVGHGDVLSEQFGIVPVLTTERDPEAALRKYLA